MSRLGFCPSQLPSPTTSLANHISVARYMGGETKISRTSLMYSLLNKEHKESAEQHKRGWGHWAETKQKQKVDVFPLMPQREKGK